MLIKKLLLAFSTLFVPLFFARKADASATSAIDTNQGLLSGWAINFDSQSSADRVPQLQCGDLFSGHALCTHMRRLCGGSRVE
jgi:hypothetical protein